VRSSSCGQELAKTLVSGGAEPRNELADTIVRLPLKGGGTLADGGKPLSLIRREAPFQIMYIMAGVDIGRWVSVGSLQVFQPSGLVPVGDRSLARPAALRGPWSGTQCVSVRVCVCVSACGLRLRA
jgi:hypothetical protein